MSALGIRSFIKKGVKKALGIVPDADTAPPNWQSRPPAPARPVEVAPQAEEAPAPVEVAPPVEAVEAVEVEAPVEVPAAVEAAAAVAALDDEVGEPLTAEAVQEILDDMVRPALQGDGGDITLIKIESNNIYVKLVGACSTCPSSIMTMKMGVEALLKEEFPSMNELIDVGTAQA
jgi:Fe-S cluster biogenesis protein NfuA